MKDYASIMAEIELGNVVFDGFEGRGIANVKECSMFPRDINRVAP